MKRAPVATERAAQRIAIALCEDEPHGSPVHALFMAIAALTECAHVAVARHEDIVSGGTSDTLWLVVQLAKAGADIAYEDDGRPDGAATAAAEGGAS